MNAAVVDRHHRSTHPALRLVLALKERDSGGAVSGHHKFITRAPKRPTHKF
jgi:hypothetical protein